MYLAYLDESGDAGGVGSPTGFFVVACFLIDGAEWPEALDFLSCWRRHLRATYGVSTRVEIKASVGFLRGGGAFKGLDLDRSNRMALYAESLQHVAGNIPAKAKAFAVAIDKAPAAQRGWA